MCCRRTPNINGNQIQTKQITTTVKLQRGAARRLCRVQSDWSESKRIHNVLDSQGEDSKINPVCWVYQLKEESISKHERITYKKVNTIPMVCARRSSYSPEKRLPAMRINTHLDLAKKCRRSHKEDRRLTQPFAFLIYLHT